MAGLKGRLSRTVGGIIDITASATISQNAQESKNIARKKKITDRNERQVDYIWTDENRNSINRIAKPDIMSWFSLRCASTQTSLHC